MKLSIQFAVVLDCLLQTYCNKMFLGGLGSRYVSLYKNDAARLNSIQHPDQEIPREFDARKQWPECKSIGQVQYQGECNIGFVFAFAAAFTDRLCIQTKGEWQLPFSPEDIINCCDSCWLSRNVSTCSGTGSEPKIVEYLALRGVATGGDLNSGIGCVPVSEETLSGRIPSENCTLSCTNPNYTRSYFGDKVRLNDILISSVKEPPPKTGQVINMTQVQIEIMKNGPVLASLFINNDLRKALSDSSYTKIYNTKYDFTPGSFEAVRVIGWGIENGMYYWLFANTHNATNFFKIRRGTNLLLIEYYMLALVPNIERRGEVQKEPTSGCQVLKTLDYLCFTLVTFNLLITK